MIEDLSHVPSKPGVYQFFDKSKIIYIGKAKDLNKRVRSYFTPAIKDRKTEQIKSRPSEWRRLLHTQKQKP